MWVFWLERVVPPLVIAFWTSITVFGVFCYFHFGIKSRATCRPKSRCQSDLSTVSVLANKSLHQDLMHSGCRGTAVPNVCLQAFSLFPLPSSPLDQRTVHRLTDRQMYTFPDQMNWQFAQILMYSKFHSKLRVLGTDDVKQKTSLFSVQGKSAWYCLKAVVLLFYVICVRYPSITWIDRECKVQNGLIL